MVGIVLRAWLAVVIFAAAYAVYRASGLGWTDTGAACGKVAMHGGVECPADLEEHLDYNTTFGYGTREKAELQITTHTQDTSYTKETAKGVESGVVERTVVVDDALMVPPDEEAPGSTHNVPPDEEAPGSIHNVPPDEESPGSTHNVPPDEEA